MEAPSWETQLILSLKSYPKQEGMTIEGCGASFIDVDRLADILSAVPGLKSLRFVEAPIDADKLYVTIIDRLSIQELEFGRTSLSPEGAAALVGLLCSSNSVERLSLSGTRIGFLGASACRGLIVTHNTPLRSLCLQGCGIGADGATNLASALGANPSLTSLDLSANSIGSDAVGSIADALRSNSRLKELQLAGNAVGDAGAVRLGAALSMNGTLQSLRLESNSIGAEGTASLGNSLARNASLRLLSLDNNPLGDKGVCALAAGVTGSLSLRCVSLERTEASVDAFETLLKGVQESPSLQLVRIRTMLVTGADETKETSYFRAARALAEASAASPDTLRVSPPMCIRAQYRAVQLEQRQQLKVSAPTATAQVQSLLREGRRLRTAAEWRDGITDGAGSASEGPPAASVDLVMAQNIVVLLSFALHLPIGELASPPDLVSAVGAVASRCLRSAVAALVADFDVFSAEALGDSRALILKPDDVVQPEPSMSSTAGARAASEPQGVQGIEEVEEAEQAVGGDSRKAATEGLNRPSGLALAGVASAIIQLQDEEEEASCRAVAANALLESVRTNSDGGLFGPLQRAHSVLRRNLVLPGLSAARIAVQQCYRNECAYRRRVLAGWRHALGARRDAALMFRAARDGRPLELQMRLRLGEAAGGLSRRGELGGVFLTPLEAARVGGHDECVRVLEAALEVTAVGGMDALLRAYWGDMDSDSDT